MTFQIGDVVEVVRSRGLEEWLGRHLVVTQAGLRGIGIECGEHRADVVATAPMPSGMVGWHPLALRRITPPDWQAPLRVETGEKA